MKSFEEKERDLESWSLTVDFFSTPRTMVSVPRTPTAALPLRTASSAYSTWNRWPSGENTVIARSYLAMSNLSDFPFLDRFLRLSDSWVSFSSFQLINYFLFWVWLVSFLNQLREQVTHLFFFLLSFFTFNYYSLLGLFQK